MKKLNRIHVITFILTILMVSNLSIYAQPEDKVIWTRSQILEIADAKAKSLGYDIENMSLSFDVYNRKWKNYLKVLSGIGGLPEVEKKLEGHEYWAVYYSLLTRGVRGGDLWIFIDYETREVITVVRGE